MSAPKINGKHGRKRKNASQSAGPSNYKRSAHCQIDEEEAENQRNEEQNQPGEITFSELIRMIRDNPHAQCRCAKLPMELRIIASFYKHLIKGASFKAQYAATACALPHVGFIRQNAGKVATQIKEQSAYGDHYLLVQLGKQILCAQKKKRKLSTFQDNH